MLSYAPLPPNQKGKRMKKILATLACVLCTCSLSADAGKNFAIVSFADCIERSELGKKEQKAFEDSKEQMRSILENMQKELEETAKKLQDPDFLDSIASEEVENMKKKFQELGQEFSRNEAQYVQIVNQAKMKFFHLMSTSVSKAAKEIATTKGYSLVVDQDVCFYYAPEINITEEVIAALDAPKKEG